MNEENERIRGWDVIAFGPCLFLLVMALLAVSIAAPGLGVVPVQAGYYSPLGTRGPTGSVGVGASEMPAGVFDPTITVTAKICGILVEWETSNELNILGFNVLRSTTPDQPTDRLTDSPIASNNLGQPVGDLYEFHDLRVGINTTYYYWLDVIELTGLATRYGPMEATAGATSACRVFVPTVQK